ncbi:spore protease YyaC [Lederbergia wuyishanensis]|uniref:Sporulation protein YyaC n=1 Tax=Lederbergia wuyishanensis TaxID=1347903 RepID=A0ABU0D225_9BACI|nr:spore protease YyaC [Lederbergia wuyishanensis]MCJ8007378.1 spore protease YyaC [Lederbergia wuyishanensis]MDQ0342455.1 putative sporulation protein YyaC [Lederbergia wuyishanensis]
MKSQPLFNPLDIFDVNIKYDDPTSINKISSGIIDLLPFNYKRPIIIVCIGTDRSTGDSLGPLVGTFLEEAGLANFHVYGTLEDPVHAVNLNDKMAMIRQKHFRPYIIGIDACLGRLKNIGNIKVGAGPVKPGAGVKKELPAVGDMHITGIVNVSGHMEFFVLQNTRLNLVMKMAKQIVAGIMEADMIYTNKEANLQLEWDINKETI